MDYEPTFDPAQKQLSINYSVRLSIEEQNKWDSYAEKYFSSKKARMVRTIVNKAINLGDPTQWQPFSKGKDNNQVNSELFDELIGSINSLTNKIENLSVDNELLKTSIARLLQEKSTRIIEPTEIVSIPLETSIYSILTKYLVDIDKVPNTENAIQYLSKIHEGKLWLNEIKNRPEGIKMIVLWEIEKIAKELFQKTGNPAFDLNGGNPFDF